MCVMHQALLVALVSDLWEVQTEATKETAINRGENYHDENAESSLQMNGNCFALASARFHVNAA